MDDRDLEARLRDRLHRRFDSAQASPELGASVAQAFATAPRRVGWTTLNPRNFQPAWSIAVLAALVAVAVLAANLRGLSGPGSPGGTGIQRTPFVPTEQPPERTFVVMSRFVDEPAKADQGLADGLLAARIMALGIESMSSYDGNGIVFSVPLGGPSDDAIRDVLRAVGDVAFVPLPAADYGDGRLVAEPGQALPMAEPALFGWDGIDSAARKATTPPSTEVALKAPAANAFSDYTTAHVGERFAIVVDGVVGLVPMISEPITGGVVTLSPGAEGTAFFARTSAILVSGVVPESWRNPDVPVILSEAEAVAAALRIYRADGVGQTQVDVIQDGSRWRAVWQISLYGASAVACPLPAALCPSAASVQVELDGVSGAFISGVAPAPA